MNHSPNPNGLMVFGHKNPDTDSVTSAVAMAYFKNAQGIEATPYVLGDLSKETAFVLDHFGVPKPDFLENVKTQIRDLEYETPDPLSPHDSIMDAYNVLRNEGVRTLPIVEGEGRLKGLLTISDIAMSLMNSDTQTITAKYDNIVKGLNGEAAYKADDEIRGRVSVVSWPLSQLLTSSVEHIDQNSIVIVGQRPDVIDYILMSGVRLLIITGTSYLYPETLELAKRSGTNVIVSGDDTYRTTQNMFMVNNISEIMTQQRFEVFYEDDYLENCIPRMKSSSHSRFPIYDEDDRYLGLIGRRHILTPHQKRVVLMDHNEFKQSADGIEQAEVTEVMDHHRIGDISTSLPIRYTGWPVGSTNTIMFQTYRTRGVDIPKHIAGLMLSGILSDTLILKSPTTTDEDRYAVEELAKIAEVDFYEYGKLMFQKGTDLTGMGVRDIFHMDYKTFDIEGEPVGIAQVFTLDIDRVMDMKEDLVAYIDELNAENDQTYTLLAVTNIVEEGSYFFFNSNRKADMKQILCPEADQGVYMASYVSRKKQIVPMMTTGIRTIKTLRNA